METEPKPAHDAPTATYEWARPLNLSPESVSRRRRRIPRLVWLIPAVPVLLACLFMVSVFASCMVTDLLGVVIATATRYGGSEFVHQESVFGSSDWGYIARTYWTSDSLADVQTHYERFFDLEPDPYSDNPALTGYQDYPLLSVLWFWEEMSVTYGVSVRLTDARTSNAFPSLPYRGTLITITNPVFVP
jgi:hypothetical protein